MEQCSIDRDSRVATGSEELHNEFLSHTGVVCIHIPYSIKHVNWSVRGCGSTHVSIVTLLAS